MATSEQSKMINSMCIALSLMEINEGGLKTISLFLMNYELYYPCGLPFHVGWSDSDLAFSCLVNFQTIHYFHPSPYIFPLSTYIYFNFFLPHIES